MKNGWPEQEFCLTVLAPMPLPRQDTISKANIERNIINYIFFLHKNEEPTHAVGIQDTHTKQGLKAPGICLDINPTNNHINIIKI